MYVFPVSYPKGCYHRFPTPMAGFCWYPAPGHQAVCQVGEVWLQPERPGTHCVWKLWSVWCLYIYYIILYIYYIILYIYIIYIHEYIIYTHVYHMNIIYVYLCVYICTCITYESQKYVCIHLFIWVWAHMFIFDQTRWPKVDSRQERMGMEDNPWEPRTNIAQCPTWCFNGFNGFNSLVFSPSQHRTDSLGLPTSSLGWATCKFDQMLGLV